MENFDDILKQNTHKTISVVIFTSIMILCEIFYGYFTKSMALLADRFHMLTHMFALIITLFAYILMNLIKNKQNHQIVSSKISALAGYTSSWILIAVGISILFESFCRLLHPQEIHFNQTVLIAFIGLFVNIICAFIMKYNHKNHQNQDYNFKAAYIHILMDALTSILAIIALLFGKLFNLYILDSLSALLSSIIILKWGINLTLSTSKILIDINILGK